MSYPRTLYKLPEGATASVSTMVQNLDEHDAALLDGWHDDPACGALPAPDEAALSTEPGAPAGGDSGASGEGS